MHPSDAEQAKQLCATGNQYYSEARYWDAIEAYTEAIELKGDDSHLLSNRSAAYLNLGKGELAVLDAKKCIDLRPRWAKGYVKAALSLRLLGEVQEAAALLERAAELDPHDPGIQVLQKEGEFFEGNRGRSADAPQPPSPAYTASAAQQIMTTRGSDRDPSVLSIWSAYNKSAGSPLFAALSPQADAPAPAPTPLGLAAGRSPSPSCLSPRGHARQATVAAAPVVEVLTTFEFTAIRRLHNPRWSASQNNELYGRDTVPHGLTFALDVVLRGRVDECTGYVMPPHVLAACVKAAITDHLDHKTLDKEVMHFESRVPTNENIVAYAWAQLQDALPGHDRTALHELRLRSSPSTTHMVAFRGEYKQC